MNIPIDIAGSFLALLTITYCVLKFVRLQFNLSHPNYLNHPSHLSHPIHLTHLSHSSHPIHLTHFSQFSYPSHLTHLSYPIHPSHLTHLTQSNFFARFVTLSPRCILSPHIIDNYATLCNITCQLNYRRKNGRPRR